MKKKNVPWGMELKKTGVRSTIIHRLIFHGGLSPSDISENLGISKKSCRNHMKRLIEENIAVVKTNDGENPIYGLRMGPQ